MTILTAVRTVLRKRITGAEARTAIDRRISASLLQKKILFYVLAFMCSSWFLLQTASFILEWDTDSPSYYTAARGLGTHINIYDDGEFQNLADSLFGKSFVIYPYIYPPFLAQMFLPLSHLSPSVYGLLVYILNILMTFAGLILMLDFLELKRCRTILPALFPFALLLFNEPLLTTIHHGQVNLLVFNVLLLSLVLQKKGRPFPAAFFLSLAVFIKIYPALFALPFLFFRRLRYLTALAVNCAALLAMSVLVSGISPWLDFGKSTFLLFFKTPDSPFIRGFQNSFGNVSLKGFLTQGLSGLHSLEPAALPAFILPAVFLLILVFARPKKRTISSDLAMEGSLLFILTLVLAPITWSHHFVIMLFPMTYLFKRIIEEKRYSAFILQAFLASQIFYNLPRGAFPFNQVRLIATLGLFGMLLYFAKRPSHDHNV